MKAAPADLRDLLRVADVLRAVGLPFGICGGWALEIFLAPHASLGRAHSDVDVAVRADDLARWAEAGHVVAAPSDHELHVLLFKAKNTREKDLSDFTVTAPHLDSSARAWLRSAVGTAHPGNHAFLALVAGGR